MFEQAYPEGDRRSNLEQRDSVSGLGSRKSVNDVGDTSVVPKRLRRVVHRNLPRLASFASILALIFLTFHCRIGNWGDTIVGRDTRRLSDGKRKDVENRTSSMVSEVCRPGEREMGEFHQRAVPDAPPDSPADATATSSVAESHAARDGAPSKKMKSVLSGDSEEMLVEQEWMRKTVKQEVDQMELVHYDISGQAMQGTSSTDLHGFEWYPIKVEDPEEEFPEGASTTEALTGIRRHWTSEEELREVVIPTALAADSAGRDAAIYGASSVQAQILSDPDYTRHLYYRLPDVPPHLDLVPLHSNFTQLPFPKVTLAALMSPLRRLFARERLARREVQAVIIRAEALLTFAARKLTANCSLKKSSRIIFVLSSRFLLADHLFCACEVVGPAMKKDEWWNTVLVPLLEPLINAHIHFNRRDGKDAYFRALAERIVTALETYSQGQRPEPMEVVQLKQEIFFGLRDSIFAGSEWEPWRLINTFPSAESPAVDTSSPAD